MVRLRCELFLELPSKVDFADYYQIITNPIALDMIERRINSPYYKSMDEFVADFKLMCSNARTYNVEGSIVYEDADEIEKAFMEALNEPSNV
jgi:ATP-dependent helicase STH1/SNF2